ncbi:hypothetical protein SUDANB108_03029 [Streptomyces sp. enrichment culture]
MTGAAPYAEQRPPTPGRRTYPLLPTAAHGTADTPVTLVTPHRTPVPLSAHPTARAIRVLRSPR